MVYRIGSIGAGGRGRIVKLAHQPENGVELAVVCDTRPTVLRAYKAEFGASLAVTDNWRDVIAREDLDAVFITTPDYLHAEQAVAALTAGKAVYLEKPLAITLGDCDRILEAAGSNGRLYVGHNMRFFPAMRQMKALIDEGRIGRVEAIWCRHFIDYGGDAYFKDWHSEQRFGNGLLLQKGAHDIDIIHWFAGAYTARTVAMGKLSVYNQVTSRRGPDEPGDATASKQNWPPLAQRGLSPVIDVEDHSMMLMHLANGVQASYTQCHYTPDGYRNYTIIGTEGRIENIGDLSSDQHEAAIHIWSQRSGTALQPQEVIRVPAMLGTHGGADPLIIADFLAFLRTGRCEGATPLDARMSVAAGIMATQSLRQGNQPFDIPLPRQTTPPSGDTGAAQCDQASTGGD